MILSIKVIPRAKKTELIGTMSDGTTRIRLRAIPEDGAANTELIRYLAETYGVSRDRVTILSGHTSQRKQVEIQTQDESLSSYSSLTAAS